MKERGIFLIFVQCNGRAHFKKSESLLERKNAGRNLVRNADKITENHADFIIAVTGDSIRSELRTLLESV